MKAILAILFFVLFAAQAQGTTWYVRQSGSDSHNCTQAQTDSDATAKATIPGALGCVGTNPGEGADHVVDVHVGTYTATYDSVNREFPKGSSWTHPFTLRAHTGETVTWRVSGQINLRIFSDSPHYSIVDGFIFDGINIVGGSSAYQMVLGSSQNGGSYVRVQNNEFINNNNGTTIFAGRFSNHSEIINNYIHGGAWDCSQGATGGGHCYPIYLEGSDFLIEGNDIHDFIAFGIHLNSSFSDLQPNRNIIRRNKLYNFGDVGGSAIIITQSAEGFQANNHPTDNQVYSNVIYNGMRGISAAGISGGGNVGTVIYGNTIYNVADQGGIEATGGRTIRNNIISAINNGSPLWNSGATVLNNLCPSAGNGCSVVSNSPTTIFNSPSTGDLTLKPGSPAIDQGANLGPPWNVDYANNPRPNSGPWELGAYEFGALGQVPAVAINSPTSNQNYLTTSQTLILAGNSSNATLVAWSCNVCGKGNANGIDQWQTGSISLQMGVNVITVTASGVGGSATAQITVTRSTKTNGLVLAMGFDAGAGSTVSDSSGQNNNGSFGSGVSWGPTGRYGKALFFNGGFVSVPDSTSLDLIDGMTIEAWVSPTVALSTFAAVLSKGGQSANQDAYYYLYGSSDVGSCPSPTPVGGFFNVSDKLACDKTALPLNQWSHLAVSYNGAVVNFYRDGTLVNSITNSDNMLIGPDPIRIGSSEFGENFTGWIDEVRIYNYARSQAEIQIDMNTAIGGGVAQLMIGPSGSLKIGPGGSLNLGQ